MNNSSNQDQTKVMQMLFEQIQILNEKISRMPGGDTSAPSSSRNPAKLPSQPTNPSGEVKAITLRSGTQYSGPPMPEERDVEKMVHENAESSRERR